MTYSMASLIPGSVIHKGQGEDQMADATIVPPSQPARVGIARAVRAVRRLPVIPIFVLLLVLVAGITAPWISPHSPTRGTLADRMLPPFWAGEQTTLKAVVEEVGIGVAHRQINLEDARKINADAVVGDGGGGGSGGAGGGGGGEIALLRVLPRGGGNRPGR